MKNIFVFILGACTICGGLPWGIQASHISILITWQTSIVLSIITIYLLSFLVVKVYRISKKQKQSITTIMSLIDLMLKGATETFNDLQNRDTFTRETPIQEIITRHKKIIQSVIDTELGLAKCKLSEKITKEFLKELKDDPNRQYNFNSACQKCINLNKIEKSLQKELDSALIEIQYLITDKLLGNGKLERYAKYEDLILREFNELNKDSNKIINGFSRTILLLFYPKLKEILNPTYYSKVMKTAYGVPSLSDLLNQQQNYYDNKVHFDVKVTGWDIFAVTALLDIGGINEILQSSLTDFLLNELHINIGMEIAELIGFGLLDITGLTLLIKGYRVLRTLYKMATNGTIDVDKILSEVNSGFSSKINGLLNSESDKITKSSISFVSDMSQKVSILFQSHSHIMQAYSEFICMSAYLKSDEQFDQKSYEFNFA